MSVTMDFVSGDYYMTIILLNGRILFVPCSLLTHYPLESGLKNTASFQIKDSCITNRNRDEILSIGDNCIEDYINQTGTEDCVLVDSLIDKMFQASTNQQSQSDNDLIQSFMGLAILQAIEKSGAHQEVTEEAVKSWMYIFVMPISWGKLITSDALFSVFAGSTLITSSNALVMTAFGTLLYSYLYRNSHAEYSTLPNSKNILCELSIGETGDTSLSMDVFSITKLKGSPHGSHHLTIDPSLSIPTLFSNNRIQLHAGYENIVALLRDAVKETIGLSMQFCNEILNHLCSFLRKFETTYQEEGSKRLDQIFPFQASEFPSIIVEEDISALRLITLMDIYAVLSPQWKLIMPEIQSLIEKQVCITRVFFTVIPEVPHLYLEHIEDILFVCIVLLKFKLEAISIKKFKYIYDNYRRNHSAGHIPYTAIDEHIWTTTSGAGVMLMEKVLLTCEESLPLSSLARPLDNKSNIDTINYVYLSTSQLRIQSLSVDANGRPSRLQAQTSDIITLDQFLVMDTMDLKFEETMLQLHISKSALSLLESLFPNALHEFATLYNKPKEEIIPEVNVADVSRFNLDEQPFHSETRERHMNYTKVMADLIHHQLDSNSPRVYVTQQKHIGIFLMVYLGYLKETLARGFGQDSDSTRYILLFEHLMRNVTIGHTDNKVIKKALDQCGWVPETEETKRKLMVYNIEDNFPISECLQKEDIKMIPARQHFAVITITKYYTKTSIFQALEDILPTDKHYKTIKIWGGFYPFDFYETVCDKIWHHVLESIYKADTLLEYSSDIDIKRLEFTLEAYKSFKVSFMEYILNTFPFTYNIHPDEKYRFPVHLKPDNCNIVLTNRLVLLSGVLPVLVSLIDLTKDDTQDTAFVFYRPSDFDDEKNLSLPMLRLIETEAKKLLEVRFQNKIQISQRQFSSVHSHQCLKLVNGDTPFGYEALKTGVIRRIETGTFALVFEYFDDDDKTSFVEIVNKKIGSNQPIKANACIITKAGAPNDSTQKFGGLGLKIADHENLSKIYLTKINDTLQETIGDVIRFEDYNSTVLSAVDIKDLFYQIDVEKFISFPFLSLKIQYSLVGYIDWILLDSTALGFSFMQRSVSRPMKVAYFDSYEEQFN